ncbi:MAG: chorismate synthase [Treponema sp.]|jgi:chorismate synthase|nr:chorismate synthase [Treponema sp.]
MSGNCFGTLFRVLTFGESHGPACGCVIDGCPAGLPVTNEAIARELNRRRPGHTVGSTQRNEADEAEILSGIFEGITLGSPLALLIRNTDHHSTDYEQIKDCYRPGHADWTWEAKFGVRDYRGGGRSSGRETVSRVAAGAVAKVLLSAHGITVRAWASAIAGIAIPPDSALDFTEAEKNGLAMPHALTAKQVSETLKQIKDRGDSAGGIVQCSVAGVPPGLGDPVFDKLDARLAAAILSIGAAKAIEFGSGFESAAHYGSTENDCPINDQNSIPLHPGVPSLRYQTNNAGGILGGISTGSPLEFRVAFKPVPSIAQTQQTVDRFGARINLDIGGRHDICLVARAVPVVEAMTALVLADALLLHRSAIF